MYIYHCEQCVALLNRYKLSLCFGHQRTHPHLSLQQYIIALSMKLLALVAVLVFITNLNVYRKCVSSRTFNNNNRITFIQCTIYCKIKIVRLKADAKSVTHISDLSSAHFVRSHKKEAKSLK